jgi:NADPH-dependent F420 reductase
MTDRLLLTIAIIGGTGNEGPGLAYRWARGGYHVIIGSRTPDKAEKIAAELNERLGRELIEGMGNARAAEACDIAVLTVPYSAHGETLKGLKADLEGKILVDVSNPIDPSDRFTVKVPKSGSAAREAQQILGDGIPVVAAFQNVSHLHLNEDGPVPCDVLVCGDDEAAKEQVLQMVAAAGLVGWDAGRLANAIVVEGLTSVLLAINKRHKIKGAGIRITGEQAP